MNPELRQALAPPFLRRNLVVAVVVGTILNLINQGDVLFGDGAVEPFKLALTWCVPFCVATYGTWNSLRVMARNRAP